MLAESHSKDVSRASRTGWIRDSILLTLEVEGKAFRKLSLILGGKVKFQKIGR